MLSTKFLTILLFILLIIPPVLYMIQKNNMAYFSENGRDPIEIELWLKRRIWFKRFRNRILDEILAEKYGLVNDEDEIDRDKINFDELIKEVDERISGKYDKNTISNAFCWMNTPEGTKYWGNKEYKFLRWYYGQYIDFHLFK